MKEFITAAKPTIGKLDKTSVIETKHDGTKVRFFEPDAGSIAVMAMVAGQKMTGRSIGTFIEFIFNCMDEPTQLYFRQRLMDPEDAFSLSGEGGLMDIWESLMEEWSARPTKQPSDFQPARRATGSGSTGTASRKGSTPSRSRSRVSSP